MVVKDVHLDGNAEVQEHAHAVDTKKVMDGAKEMIIARHLVH